MAMEDSLSIVLCGEAGQGIQTIEVILTRLFKTAHDPTDRGAAFSRAIETAQLPLGIFYMNPSQSLKIISGFIAAIPNRFTGGGLILQRSKN